MPSYFVPGPPPSKGSFRAIPRGKDGNKGVFMQNSSKRLKPWTKELQSQLEKLPQGGPFRVEIEVVVERPKYHFKKGSLRDEYGGVDLCIRRPDLDKVARAALDAMTGYVYHDDSQVVSLTVERYWSGPRSPSGVTVTVIDLTEAAF